MEIQPKTPSTKGPAGTSTGDVHLDVVAQGAAPEHFLTHLIIREHGA